MDKIWVSCPCCNKRRTIQIPEGYDDDYHYYYYCDWCWYEYHRYWDAYHYYCHQWYHYYCAIGGVPASEPIIQ